MREIRETDDSEVEIRTRLLSPEERAKILEEYHAEISASSDSTEFEEFPREDTIDKKLERIDISKHLMTPEEREVLLREHRLMSEEERAELIKRTCDKLESKRGEMREPSYKIPDAIEKDETLKKTIDIDEVRRLYFDEGLSMVKIARRYGYRTSSVIGKIFKENEWEPRPVTRSKIEIQPNEVYRLYLEEGRTLLEIAKHFGFKSANSIRKIFAENNWETRKKWKKIDPDLVYNLYFDQGLSFAKVKTKLGLSSLYPIVSIFEEQGWDARPAGGCRKVELDQDEVYRLYYKEDMTMQQIAKLYGYKTSCVISRIF